jgi:hypothetical protein
MKVSREGRVPGLPLSASVPGDYTGEDVDWDTSPIGSPELELDDLTDVNAPAPDDGDVLTWDEYAAEWVAAPAGATGLGMVIAVFDGGGGVPSADITFDVPVPWDGTIIGWTMLSDVAGDAEVDIASVAPGGAMPVFPGDAITGSAVPSMTGDDQVSSTTLTGWTTTVTQRHIYRFKLVSAATLTRLTFVLEVSH